ncbi:MAG: hypothetical protein JST92_26445 [Deltaproteobacteria bacterium]|nr:hypothetical protein [Deltaproteobacteria bacterium]
MEEEVPAVFDDEGTPDAETPHEWEAAASEPAEGESQGLEGWVAPPPEPQPEGAGWMGQALAATSPLSPGDAETLASVGVDAQDAVGALRLLAGLVRALQKRGLIDVAELHADLEAARAAAPVYEAAPAEGAEGIPEAADLAGDAPAEAAAEAAAEGSEGAPQT